MSRDSLPSGGQAYRILCATGDLFHKTPLVPETLEGYTYNHPSRGQQSLAADPRILQATGRVYVKDQQLRVALDARGARTGSHADALRLVQSCMKSSSIMLGMCGYATSGYPCGTEATTIERVYKQLCLNGNKPSIASDGGSPESVLGLHGVIAKEFGIQTIGFTPLQGLKRMAPRDHVVLSGQTYHDRERHVGTLPDLLVCVGGGIGAERECTQALKLGSTVLLVVLRDDGQTSLAHYWKTVQAFKRPFDEGRLVVCDNSDDLASKVNQALRSASKTRKNRGERLRALKSIL